MAIASELAQVVWRLGDLCHFYRSFNWRIKCAVCFEITLQRPLRNPDTEFVTRYRNRISFLQLQGHFQANQVKIGNSDVKFRRFYFLMDQIMLDWHGGLSFFRLFLCLPAFSSVSFLWLVLLFLRCCRRRIRAGGEIIYSQISHPNFGKM